MLITQERRNEQDNENRELREMVEGSYAFDMQRELAQLYEQVETSN